MFRIRSTQFPSTLLRMAVPQQKFSAFIPTALSLRRYSDLKIVPKLPIRPEFIISDKTSVVTTKDLEELDIGLDQHRKPENFRDYFAYYFVQSMRLPADLFFRKKYLHRAVTLETVAAVPGMVAGMLRHLTSLRKMKHDGGWIHHLLHEAENERMHLLIWMKASNPSNLERFLVFVVQGVFFNAYLFLYTFFPTLSHRIVGYLEEEAIISYTSFLEEIDQGRIENVAAPKLAIEYYHLDPQATLRDVVLAVRADEANHRDTNHILADRILNRKEDLREAFPAIKT